MEIILAGYNLDCEVINQLSANSQPRQDITPETLSAAYARISRDPRPINQLRQAARLEVDKARKSNTAIIFGLGHSSVAEHAVFNFDLINISRYAMEELEKFRLASYTEKSQRYITLEKDFLLPEEIKGTALESRFLKLINQQSKMYNQLFAKLKDYTYQNNPDLGADPKNQSLLEGWAKEDARYVTSLATYSQVGLTINARSLEKLLRRFSVHPLAEIREIGNRLHDLVKNIAPSIVKYPQGNDFEKNTYPEIGQSTADYQTTSTNNDPCRLLTFTTQADEQILAALLFKSGSADYQSCLTTVKQMSLIQKTNLFKSSIRNMKLYDQMIREYELVDLTYELTLSAACFGQLKRHRMASVITQAYNPALGYVIPPAIRDVGLADQFEKILDESTALYYEAKQTIPQACEYLLTNAHQRKVIFKTNLRELYHISRLREDAHAQWDIRNLTGLMTAAAKKVIPVCSLALGGKDNYEKIYRNLFS